MVAYHGTTKRRDVSRPKTKKGCETSAEAEEPGFFDPPKSWFKKKAENKLFVFVVAKVLVQFWVAFWSWYRFKGTYV